MTSVSPGVIRLYDEVSTIKQVQRCLGFAPRLLYGGWL